MSNYTKTCSRYKTWKPVTIDEMKAFVGVILNMGIVQLQNIHEYWSTSFTCSIPFFWSVLPRDRFFQIFGMLHVEDITCTTKNDKIKPFIDHIFQQNFIPHRQVSVDESVIAFKERVSFRQYLKNKPCPWGIKVYVLSDSITGYMHNLRIYFGKDTELIDQTDFSHTVRVVMTLVSHPGNKGYDLYTDRFYTSPALAVELQRVGITLTGTIQSNKRGLPMELKQKPKTPKKQKMPKGSVESYRSGSIMALAWQDKRMILMLSTKYSNEMTDVVSR